MSDPLRSGCSGILPLTARLESWQRSVCEDATALATFIEEHGSPVNVLDRGPFAANAADLSKAAADAGVPLEIYFARKANKALCFVDEARTLGLGIDLASEAELTQCLERGVPGEALMMTAAIKPRALLRRCVEAAVTISVDNADELTALSDIAASTGVPAQVAIRIAPELPGRSPTRFGMAAGDAIDAMAALPAAAADVRGVHFHLDGYAVEDRVAALAQALEVVDGLREHGLSPRFVDIGGGIPIRYLDERSEWDAFWSAHRGGLESGADPLTYDGRALGTVYPAHQVPTRGEWLRRVLEGDLGGESVTAALRRRELALRCEPGRSLLDGCGLTAARVEFRKQRADGVWLVGLAMNRTQCRSAADDFLVDPLLVAADGGASRTEAIDAYLVGAYCIERELITWRRLNFPRGVAVGDIVVFPNTAGYLMHILESASHQIPLAANLVRGHDGVLKRDDIDRA